MPKITIENKIIIEEISSLVSKILNKKELDSLVDTKDIETQIDQLLYKLYDLSPEEIIHIESQFH